MTRTRQPDAFTDLDAPEWLALFENVQDSWFRLETLQVYDVGYEREEFEQFLRTGELNQPVGDWQRLLTRHKEAGRSLRRVHVIKEPLSDYLRYELAVYRQNTAAGEEIRLIPCTSSTWPVELPKGYDFWLFDDADVWEMRYDSAGRFLEAVRSGSSSHLADCRRWRDLALYQSVSLADYLRSAA